MKISVSKRCKSQYHISGVDNSLSPTSAPLKEPRLNHWQVRYMQGIELTKLRKSSKPVKQLQSTNFSSTSSSLFQTPSIKGLPKSSSTHFPAKFPNPHPSQGQVPNPKLSIKSTTLNSSHFVHSSLLPRHLRPSGSNQTGKSLSGQLLRPRRLSPYQASHANRTLSSALKDLWTESNSSEAYSSSLFIQSQLLDLQSTKPQFSSPHPSNPAQPCPSYPKLRKKPVVMNKNT